MHVTRSRCTAAQKPRKTMSRSVPELLLEITYLLHAKKVVARPQSCDESTQVPTHSVPELLLEIIHRLSANKVVARPRRSTRPLETYIPGMHLGHFG